jgi:tRNA pseudouridine38-40 synthase
LAKQHRFFVHIAYRGSNYHGWQRQPGVLTIQEVMENALSSCLKQKIVCIGCGRTDAGVHASQFFFHFDIEKRWNFDLKFRLNKMLPDDICIFDIDEVFDYPHAQFSAMDRTYEYLIHTQKDPFLSELSAYYPERFDILSMQKAVDLISNNKDFVNFCRCPSRHSSTICDIKSAKLYTQNNGEIIRFQITSNRFLQGMVRMIAQSLIDVGTGSQTLTEFEKALSLKQQKRLKSAYPQGLYLSKVSYPFMEKETESTFFNLIDSLEWEEVKNDNN